TIFVSTRAIVMPRDRVAGASDSTEGLSAGFAAHLASSGAHSAKTVSTSIPVLIYQVFCRCWAERAEPLRAPRRHIDEIACGYRVPVVSQAVDASSCQHQQAMLHHV